MASLCSAYSLTYTKAKGNITIISKPFNDDNIKKKKLGINYRISK